MKIPNSRAAARWFDKVDAEFVEKVAAEPEEPGTIHAWLHDPDDRINVTPASQWILNQSTTALLEFGPAEAACGMAVRVVYRMAFDTDDADTCPRCLELAEQWASDREEYHRRVNGRNERWRERDRARRAAGEAAWNDLERQVGERNAEP